eukprot:TRINITY_DN1307_c0_g1_i5.p1 TRINITY_DN1307_c0_g1~~TRINITY_DN1307_c0_g1_i5.p1  ORF type:complete len:101 (-),score=9.74 TRINITY_DN1307_c0_g1_i5:281-583(-)
MNPATYLRGRFRNEREDLQKTIQETYRTFALSTVQHGVRMPYAIPVYRRACAGRMTPRSHWHSIRSSMKSRRARDCHPRGLIKVTDIRQEEKGITKKDET